MKKLYRFTQEFGRMGDLKGIFVAEESEINAIIGEAIYYGEVLGKNSEIFSILQKEYLEILSEDQEFIKKFIEIIENFGFNPLDYYDEDENEYEMIPF